MTLLNELAAALGISAEELINMELASDKETKTNPSPMDHASADPSLPSSSSEAKFSMKPTIIGSSFVLLLVFLLLFFIPSNTRFVKTYEGVELIDGQFYKNVTVETDILYSKYLLRADKASGTITVHWEDGNSGTHQIVYSVVLPERVRLHLYEPTFDGYGEEFFDANWLPDRDWILLSGAKYVNDRIKPQHIIVAAEDKKTDLKEVYHYLISFWASEDTFPPINLEKE